MHPPHQPDSPTPPASPVTLTPEQLQRWAELIAAGADPFPPDLPNPVRQRLAVDVRKLLRERLLELVAFAVARDVVRQHRHDKEDMK